MQAVKHGAGRKAARLKALISRSDAPVSSIIKSMQKTKGSQPAKPKAKNERRAVKEPKNSTKRESRSSTANHGIPFELQQLLLNIFQNALPIPDSRPMNDVLQEVKGHLYNRDFASAFGKDEYLRAYAIRWSSSRALGYLKLLNGIFKDYFDRRREPVDGDDWTRKVKITCIGGGAGAEIISLAGILHMRKERKSAHDDSEMSDTEAATRSARSQLRVEATFIDIANWTDVIDRLHQGIISAPPVSPYASAAVKAANAPLLGPTVLDTTSRQHDVLQLSGDELKGMAGGRDLVTIFFTLNELYTTSMPKTQAFLLKLTQAVGRGTLLLVVDSAGSYSSVSLNGLEKKYPMHWLLDHALLKPEESKKETIRRHEADPNWEKLEEKESEWFRIPDGLRYPLDLENMRYQLHLYRRL